MWHRATGEGSRSKNVSSLDSLPSNLYGLYHQVGVDRGEWFDVGVLSTRIHIFEDEHFWLLSLYDR